jgi:hypothetical protein
MDQLVMSVEEVLEVQFGFFLKRKYLLRGLTKFLVCDHHGENVKKKVHT